MKISIHTPAQGVTIPVYRCCKSEQISIHTPAQGVTFYAIRRITMTEISIHTPAQGVTDKTISFNKQGRFQSTLPHRE